MVVHLKGVTWGEGEGEVHREKKSLVYKEGWGFWVLVEWTKILKEIKDAFWRPHWWSMVVCLSKEHKRKFSNFSNSWEWFILPGNFSNPKYEGIQAYIWGPQLWVIHRFIHLDKQIGWHDLLKSSPDGDFDIFFNSKSRGHQTKEYSVLAPHHIQLKSAVINLFYSQDIAQPSTAKHQRNKGSIEDVLRMELCAHSVPM